jgi:hypothetical protein
MLVKLSIPEGVSYKHCQMMMFQACYLAGTATAGQTTFSNLATYGSIINAVTGAGISILDNSKAGGWTSDTTWTNVETLTTTAQSFHPILTMYTTTGKSDYPYAFVQMIATSTAYTVSGGVGVDNNYNISYQPQITVGLAEDLTSAFDPKSQGYDASTSSYRYHRGYAGHATGGVYANHAKISNVKNHHQYLTSNKVMWNFHQFDSTPSNGTSTKCTFYISINAEQFTIYQLPFDGTTDNDYSAIANLWGGGMMHYGTRTTQGWEDGYSDNPSWTLLSYYRPDPGYDYGAYWTTMRQNNPWTSPSAGVVSLNQTLQDTTYGRNPISNRKYYSSTYTSTRQYAYDNSGDTYWDKINPFASRNGYESLAGTSSNGYGWSNITNKNTGVADSSWTGTANTYETTIRCQLPMFRGSLESAPPGNPSYSGNNTYIFNTPVVDPNTGLVAPPALPIMIQASNGVNSGGQLKGLMYGGQIPNTSYLDTVRTKEAKYSINGSLFIPIHFGPCNWESSAQYSLQRGVDMMWLGV